MYRRFLNNDDYLGIITPEALAQLTRGNDARFIQAEESAEMSIVEYLSENYEIEKELAKGKYIAEYDHRITYPVGVHVYFEGQIHEVIRSVSGYRKPATAIYWEECSDIHVDAGQVVNYSQFNTYYPGDKVNYNGVVYIYHRDTGTSSMISVSRWSVVGSRRKSRYGSLSSILCGQSLNMKGRSIL